MTSSTRSSAAAVWSPLALALMLAACSQQASSPASSDPYAALPGSPYDGVNRAWTDTKVSQQALQQLAVTSGDNALSSLTWTSASSGWGPIEKDTSNGEAAAGDGHTISIGGTTYARGLGMHANAQVIYALNAQCKTFTSYVGVDDEVGKNGSVGFQVYGDGVLRYDSGVMRGGDKAKQISMDIAGVKELKLVVNNGGDNLYYDHADWGNPVLSVCSGAAPAPSPSPTPTPAPTPSPVTYSGPITITKGGTYSGNWESQDPYTPAVLIATSDPVTIQNSNIRSRGDLIKAWWSNLTVRNTNGYGLNPNVNGGHAGRFISSEDFYSVDVENNYLESTGGMYFHNFHPSSSQTTVKVLRNRIKNIDGRNSNGNNGYTGDRYRLQFLQLNAVHATPNVEIAWNEVINEPGKSSLEENLNLYESSGTSASPFNIHDNYIQGAYAISPASDSSYSGGGILLGDGDVSNLGVASGYANVYNNQIVSTSNQGIGIAGGHDYNVWGNRVLSSGRLSDGSVIAAENVGVYVWDILNGKSKGTFSNNSMHDNLIGWSRINGDGSTWQNNTWFQDCSSSCYNNKDWGSTVTTATEAAEYQSWLTKLRNNSVTIGAQ